MLLLPTNRPVPTEPKLGVIRTNTGTLIKPKLKKKNGKVCGYSNWTFGKGSPGRTRLLVMKNDRWNNIIIHYVSGKTLNKHVRFFKPSNTIKTEPGTP